MKQKQKIDWCIDYCANGIPCACCGEIETSFPEYMANAHTHGLEKYGHLNFQIVLALLIHVVGKILNDIGLRVQAGEKFKSDDVLSDALADGYNIRLLEVEEGGRKVLRILLPDPENHLPGEKFCKYPYNRQANFRTA